MHCRFLRHSFGAATWAQMMSPSEILQEISKLERVGSVLHVAAHPDDENTTLLTYLAQEERLETAYFLLPVAAAAKISLVLS